MVLNLLVVDVVFLVVPGQLILVVIDIALVLVAVHAVLVQVRTIMNDVSLVGVAVGAVFAQVPLVVIDIALIGVTIRAVLRQIFLIATNVFLVVLDVLLLRGRILALGICTTGEQTGKSNREHTSTDYEFCVHKSSLLLSRCWNYHHTYKSKHLERRKVSPPS